LAFNFSIYLHTKKLKNLIIAVGVTMLSLNVLAQDKLPEFGVISKADLQMKTCDFDPDTDVVYLLDVGDATILSSIEVVTERRMRIKILTEKGIAKGNIKLDYYSHDQYEQIDNVKGYTYNLDAAGNIETLPLEPTMIFDKKLDNSYSEIAFAFPAVKVGSVIEFKYRLIKHRGCVYIDDWYFQKSQAVRCSSYHVTIPTSLIFTMQVVKRQEVLTTKPNVADEGYSFTMKNIPGLGNEPYQAGIKDYIQRVDFQLSGYVETGGFKHSYITTWDKLTDKILEDEFIGFQLRKKIPATADLNAALATAKNDQQKTEMVYRYVQRNMDWNNDYSIQSDDGIKKAWDKKSGNTADINLILLTLLKDAGIKAYPCMVSTRENGKVNTSYPFMGQFNAIYIYAVTDGKPYILNAADKYNPPGLIPANVQFSHGFVVDSKSGGFISLSSYEHKNKQQTSAHLQVDENGRFVGRGNVSRFNYAKNYGRRTYTNDNVKEWISNKSGMEITIDSVATSGWDKDTDPLNVSINFSGALQTSGEYSFLPYNLFSGFNESPFIADKRQTDIDFGYTQQYTMSGGHTIPQNYVFEELPKNISMIMPDTSIVFTRITQQQNNTVNFRITMECSRPQYSTEEYPMLKEFYRKLYALLNEKIVIKKKL